MSIVSLQDEKMIRELPTKSKLESGYDWLIIEGKDGTKRMRVEDFLANSLIGNLFYDNISSMCESSNIAEGSVIYTKGFYTEGDGGGARYVIKYDPATPTNGTTILELKKSSTLKAFLYPDGDVYPEQVGAIGDGISDDTGSIKKLLELDYPIRFNPNKKYRLEQNINIPTKSYIDFNGSTIILESSNIIIKDASDVTIIGLNLDCHNNGRGIYVFKSNNVTIMNCNINNIKDLQYGIEISQSNRVNVLNNNFVNGSNAGRGIYIHADYNVAGDNTDNIIIDECNFYSVKEPVYIDGNVKPVGNVAINDCSIEYINNNIGNTAIVNNVVNSSLSINNLNVINGYQVLTIGYGSKSFISLNDINVKNSYSLYSFSSNKECVVCMGGYHNYTSDNTDVTDNYVFRTMDVTLLINATFNINGYRLLNRGYTHQGFVNDTADTKNSMANKISVNLSSTTGTLYIDTFKNAYYNIIGNNNILVIERGIEGQIIEIVSSNNLLLKNISSGIVLLESGDITLHKYKGVKLIYLEGKWIQI